MVLNHKVMLHRFYYLWSIIFQNKSLKGSSTRTEMWKRKKSVEGKRLSGLFCFGVETVSCAVEQSCDSAMRRFFTLLHPSEMGMMKRRRGWGRGVRMDAVKVWGCPWNTRAHLPPWLSPPLGSRCVTPVRVEPPLFLLLLLLPCCGWSLGGLLLSDPRAQLAAGVGLAFCNRDAALQTDGRTRASERRIDPHPARLPSDHRPFHLQMRWSSSSGHRLPSSSSSSGQPSTARASRWREAPKTGERWSRSALLLLLFLIHPHCSKRKSGKECALIPIPRRFWSHWGDGKRRVKLLASLAPHFPLFLELKAESPAAPTPAAPVNSCWDGGAAAGGWGKFSWSDVAETPHLDQRPETDRGGRVTLECNQLRRGQKVTSGKNYSSTKTAGTCPI